MLTTEWGNVGTKGGCGAGWGPGACLVATRSSGDCVEQTGRTPTRTSTRPPHPLHPAPCPYRTLGRKHLNGYDHPIRSSTFIWKGVYAPLNRNCLTSAPIPARELISPHVQGISSVVGVKVE